MRLHVMGPGQAAYCKATALVITEFEDGEPQFGDELQAADAEALRGLCERGVITGKAGEAYYLSTPGSAYAGVLVLGLGAYAGFNAEALRRGAGSACAIFKRERVSHAVFDGTSGDALPVEAFIEGVMLGQYDFTAHKDSSGDPPVAVEEMTVIATEGERMEALREGCARTVQICRNANWARDLANAPANKMTPTTLAAQAEEIAKETGCTCQILNESEMAALGMEALIGVSKGSAEEARLIFLEYKHDEATQTLAIVGKGITFDTGGISIKPADSMHEMKYDMCGAAAVLGAMRSVCQLKPKINVVCVVPSSENKTGAEAQVPGDIVKAYNGKTIEVHNTDAEGRLVLADALAFTVDKFKPDAIVDAATLTGACVVTLGHYAAGLMSNNDDLTADLQLAADASGERVWPFPVWDDYTKLIEGTHADLCNIGPRAEAGSITAACFLKEFVGDTPWAHLDIAGTAWGGKHISYQAPQHASGYGVRLLTQWILNQSQS